MKDNLLKSKALNEKQTLINRLNEELETLKSANLKVIYTIPYIKLRTKASTSNLKNLSTHFRSSGKQLIESKTKQSTFIDDAHRQYNTPKSITKPLITLTNSHKADKSNSRSQLNFKASISSKSPRGHSESFIQPSNKPSPRVLSIRDKETSSKKFKKYAPEDNVTLTNFSISHESIIFNYS